jgi:Histidine kinase-, DNA gyrase B-, and HSP90-like ATPase
MAEQLATQALDNLVTQFSSALDCLRELVQNSMDAGSPVIDVWTEYHAGDDALGTIALHVDDNGVGMDSAIIDKELTRLFASSKEDDLTKIGKFGIGFVSIFALGPEAVLLHTGRGGEFWEILFHADRSFTKTRVEEPVEGTQITLYISGDEERYREIVSEGFDTLKRWCRHSDVEITFEERSGMAELPGCDGPVEINEPFELEGLIAVHQTVEGTQMALAYSLAPSFGFYNQGLTLAVHSDPDEVAQRFSNITFKIKSRYLEHTLSRETVLKDENYEKAMALLREAADGPLHEQLVAGLQEVVAVRTFGLAEYTRYQQLMGFLLKEPAEFILRLGKHPLLRTVDGGVTSLAAVAEAAVRDGRIFITDAPSALVTHLGDQSIPVLLGRRRADADMDEADVRSGEDLEPALRLVVAYAAHHRRSKLLKRLLAVLTSTDYGAGTAGLIVHPEEVYLAVEVDDPSPPAEAAFIAAAARLLEGIGGRYRRLVGCVLSAPSDKPPLFLVAREVGPLMAIPPDILVDKDRPRRPEAAVNRDHPQFRALLGLYRQSPGLAAYCLAKDLLLVEDRLMERDLDLLAAVFPEARAQSLALAHQTREVGS